MKRLLKLKFIIPAVIALTAGITLPIALTPHKHKIVNEAWQQDSTNHWHECTKCEELVDLAAHEYGEWQFATDKCEKSRACITCGYVVTEEVAHTYDDACDTDCNVCGTERTITHTCDALIALKNPTCTDKGMKAHYECAVCDKYLDENKNEVTYESLIIEALGHIYGELVAKVDATCTENGLAAHYHCSVCDEYFDSEKKEIAYSNLVIVSSGHNYGELIVEVPATCEAAGKKAHYHCNACDKYFDADKKEVTAESLVISTLGHNYGELVAEVPATCEVAGKKAHHECSICHKLFDVDKRETTAESLVIAALGHNYGELVAEVPATCEAAGKKVHYECSACHKLFDAEKKEVTAESLVIAALGHNYGELVAEVPATCEAAGKKAYYECSACHKLFNTEKKEVTAESLVIAALGHNYGDLVAEQASTCTETGIKTHYHCLACDTYFDEQKNKVTYDSLVITAKGHTYGQFVTKVDATCEVTGLKAHYHCTVCNKYFDEEKKEVAYETLVIEALGHTYGELVLQVDATCEATGLKAHYKCSVCNKYFDEDKNVVTYETLVIEALGHTYGELVLQVDATCTNTGLKAHYKCSVCNKYFDEEKNNVEYQNLVINKISHSLGELIAKVDATCEEEGLEAHYHCSSCRKYFTQVGEETSLEDLKISKSGHNYGTLVEKLYSNCENEGFEEHYQCNACEKYFDSTKNEVEYEDLIIATTSHDYGNLVVAKDPTCTENGRIAYYQCRLCLNYFNKDKEEIEEDDLVIQKLGHNYGEVVAQVPATCESTGTKAHYHCSVCDTYFTADTKEVILEEDLVISAKGHSYGDLVTLVPSTCEEEGLEAHYQCSVCEKYFDAEKNNVEYESLVIAKLGHNYDVPQYTWNEDHSECTATKVCKNDSKHIVTEIVSATYEVTKEATAEEDGIGVYTTTAFTDPDFEVQTHEEEIPATGHNYGTATYEWNADYSECVATVTCSDDECEKEITETSTATIVTVAPTCESDGKITYNVVFKNALFKAQIHEVVIDALGHTDGEAKYVWNSDLTECSATLYCANDTKHIIDEEIVSVSVDTDEPTCVDDGLITYTATFTKSSFETQIKEKSIDSLGHTPGTATYEWTNEFGCIGTVECTICHQDILIENANVTSKTTKATCEEDGKTIYTATFTNSSFETQTKEVVLDKTGHTDGEVIYTWNEDNSKCTAVLKCANDTSHILATETVDSTNVVTPATCEEKGKTVYTATFENTKLGVAIKEVEIALLPHTNDTPIYEWVTEYTEYAGEIVCSECGHQIATATATISSVTTDPTCEDAGQTVYTLEFTNSLFETQTETVVIPKLGHKNGEITYTWNEGNVSCTAELHCEHDNNHILDSETVNAIVVTTPAECEENGSKVYTATFTKEGFEEQVITVVLEKFGHTEGTPSYVWAEDNSTCTATIICTVCNDVILEEPVNTTYTTTATCIEAGQTTFVADFTKVGLVDQTKTVNTDAFGHTYIVEEDLNGAVAATCTTSGKIAYYHCERCDKYFNESEEVVDTIIIEALGHIINESNADKIICNRENCELSYTSYYIRGSFNEWISSQIYRLIYDVNTNTATVLIELFAGDLFKICIDDGWTTNYGWYSTDVTFNNTQFVSVEDSDDFKTAVAGIYEFKVDYSSSNAKFIITKVEHTHTYPEELEWSYNEEAHYYACSVCVRGKLDYEEHIFDSECDTTCNTCNYVRITETEHTYDHGCDSDCNKCNEIRTVEPHTYGELVAKVNAKCTENGHIAYYQCSTCDQYFDVNKTLVESIVIGKLGHDYDLETWSKDADGHYHLCKRTNCNSKDEVIAHNPNIEAATEEQAKVCTECGYQIEAALAHVHLYTLEVKEGHVKTPATCQSYAVYYKSCRCGDNGEETFLGTEYADHEYDYEEEIHATCESNGNEAHYICTICNKLFQEVESIKTEVDASDLIIYSQGHSNEIVEAKEETCTVDGNIDYYHCTVCSKKFEDKEGTKEIQDVVIKAHHNIEYLFDSSSNTKSDIAKCSNCDNYVINFYVKGGMNSWSRDDKYRFIVDEYNMNIATLNLYIDETQEFKVVDEFSDWLNQFGISNTTSQLVFGDRDSNNITVSSSGIYTLTITGLETKLYTLTISDVKPECVEHTPNDEWLYDSDNHYHYCTVCKLIIDNLEHDIIIDEEVSPTCTKTGLTEGSHCSVCDYRIAQEEVDATGHSHNAVVTQPTCTEAGYTTHTCACGDTYTDTPVDALGHNMIVDEAVSPTCTETGLTEGSHCSRCDYIIEQEVADALGHDITEWNKKVDATCTTNGTKGYYICSVCHKYIDQDEITIIDDINIPKLNHSYGEFTSNNDGTHTKICANDNEHTVTESCSLSWVETTPATNDTDGLETGTCSVCNYVTTRSIPKLHTCVWEEEFTIDIPATCTTVGSKSKHCSSESCNKTTEVTEIPAIGHTYGEWTVEVTPTLSSVGNLVRTCHCEEEETSILPILSTDNGYEYSTTYVDCESNGTGTYIIEKEDEEWSFDIEIDPRGHNYGEWSKGDDPTVDSTGTLIRKCSYDDSHIDSYVLPKLNNSDYEYTEDYEDCLSSGKGIYNIEVYEIVFEYEIEIDAKNEHSYVDKVTEPTCTSKGYTTHTCSICDDSYTDSETDALGHTWDDVSVSGTKKTYTCSCGVTTTSYIVYFYIFSNWFSSGAKVWAHLYNDNGDTLDVTLTSIGNNYYYFETEKGEYINYNKVILNRGSSDSSGVGDWDNRWNSNEFNTFSDMTLDDGENLIKIQYEDSWDYSITGTYNE